jgi:hypothetical protein
MWISETGATCPLEWPLPRAPRLRSLRRPNTLDLQLANLRGPFGRTEEWIGWSKYVECAARSRAQK